MSHDVRIPGTGGEGIRSGRDVRSDGQPLKGPADGEDVEILSPAGNPDGLAAAVKGGCDAVYLAGKDFGARAFAGNFTDRQLEGAVNYAHDHGVKVHVAVNTSIRNQEMSDAVSFVRFLRDIGADAVLVQDLGLMRAIGPIDIPKHASTQMQIHSLEGLRWCGENGFDRAVLARELTLEELSSIVPDSPIETEVFVQGALCHCMSGGCLMSSFMGGRSGNRGSCAQPCRKRYESGDRSGYLLSCADLFAVDRIEDLRSIGVTSLKIEGRMRSPAYAYLSAKVYSMAEDGDFSEEYEESLRLLRTVFNRGTCEGYLGGVVSPVQSLYPDNRGFLLGEVDVADRAFRWDGPEPVGVKDGLSLFDGDRKVGGFKVVETDPIRIPFKMPDGRYQLYRTYDPRIDGVKNLIGRTPKLDGRTQRAPSDVSLPRLPHRDMRPEFSAYVSTIRTLEAAVPYARRVYFEHGDRLAEAAEVCAQRGVELVDLLPRFDALDECVHDGPVMVNGPGQLRACRGSPRIYASSVFNCYNSWFPSEVYQTTLSVELSRNDVSDLIAHRPGRAEVMAFGRTELMYSRDPGMGNGQLVDEKGAAFPVYTDRRGFGHLLNSVDLFLLDYAEELGRSGVASLGIDLRKRPPALAKAVGEYFAHPDPKLRSKIEQMCGGFTTGLYRRGVQ